MARQIVAMGGGGFSMEPSNPLLDDYILARSGKERPRVCLLPTASGDADSLIVRFHAAFPPERAVATHLPLFNRRVQDIEDFLREQDVVYVGGGNTANMLAVWRLHGVHTALRGAYDAGVVLAGLSAGSLCWFEAGVTDSFGLDLSGLRDGLGFLSGSHCPHYDGEARREPTYRALIQGGFPPGYALDDGAALCFVDEQLHEAVSSRPNARALRLRMEGTDLVEEPLPIRHLGP